MTSAQKIISLDPVWEEKYAAGHAERAPWDSVVSFIYRYRPRDRAPGETEILEVGCGPASNLWFAAREGFAVTGIDGSASAIGMAKKRFAGDGLAGRLDVGDFTSLPYEDASFDLAIDRAALTCAGTLSQKKALTEIHRVLRPGGRLFYTPYADTHASKKAGAPGPDDVIVDIGGGTLQGVGQIRFIARDEIAAFLPDSLWAVEVIEYNTFEDLMNPAQGLHSAWKIIARKK